MNKSQDFAFKVAGFLVPLSQLAVMDTGDDSSDTELMAEAPDGMVFRFQPGSEKEGITGNLAIPLNAFIPAAEMIYKEIQGIYKTPSKALAYDVKEKFNNQWPKIEELLKDTELFIDAFENSLFDILRLIILKPNKETRYLIEAVSSECIIEDELFQLRLLLIECKNNSLDHKG